MKKKKDKFKKYDELGDGFRKVHKNQIIAEKSKKSKRNYNNVLKSKNIDNLSRYDDSFR
jgi:hypothetical protein